VARLRLGLQPDDVVSRVKPGVGAPFTVMARIRLPCGRGSRITVSLGEERVGGSISASIHRYTRDREGHDAVTCGAEARRCVPRGDLHVFIEPLIGDQRCQPEFLSSFHEQHEACQNEEISAAFGTPQAPRAVCIPAMVNTLMN
jgi:hypothetical protein